MKKVFLLIFAAILTSGVFAQPYMNYINYTSTWTMRSGGSDIINDYVSNFKYVIKGDTIIGGYDYFKLYHVGVDSIIPRGAGTPRAIYVNSYAGALREDFDRKFYFIYENLTTESLLFDFNIQVGSYLHNMQSNYGCNNPPRLIQSYDMVYLGSIPRRRYKTDNFFVNRIIEGVGSEGGLIEQGSMCLFYESFSSLICYSKDNNFLQVSSNINCDQNSATIPPTPVIAITEPTCDLPFGTIVISSPLGTELSYSIDSVDFSNTTGIFTNLAPGNYSVFAKNYNGFVSTAAKATISTSLAGTVPEVQVMQPDCNNPNGSIIIKSPLATGLYYSIDRQTYTNSTGIFNSVKPGSYNISVKNQLGCTSVETTVDINPVPELKLKLNVSDNPTLAGEIVHFSVSGSQPFTVTSWLPTSDFPNQTALTQIVRSIYPATYLVTGTSGPYCNDTAEIRLEIVKSDNVYFPNSFTPNHDGLNDKFKCGCFFVDKYQLQIFNRWGEIVFISTNKNTGWDGTYRGKVQPSGTYIYLFNGTSMDGKIISQKGTINLIGN